jgi:hypothetical protein
MNKSFAVLGVCWLVLFVVVTNIAWAMRNRSRRARRFVDIAKQFTAQRQDYAILVWAVTGDVLLAILLLAFFMRRMS